MKPHQKKALAEGRKHAFAVKAYLEALEVLDAEDGSTDLSTLNAESEKLEKKLASGSLSALEEVDVRQRLADIAGVVERASKTSPEKMADLRAKFVVAAPHYVKSKEIHRVVLEEFGVDEATLDEVYADLPDGSSPAVSQVTQKSSMNEIAEAYLEMCRSTRPVGGRPKHTTKKSLAAMERLANDPNESVIARLAAKQSLREVTAQAEFEKTAEARLSDLEDLFLGIADDFISTFRIEPKAMTQMNVPKHVVHAVYGGDRVAA